MDFKKLVQFIEETHTVFQHRAVTAINRSLVFRNWLFGFFIVEFEQNGRDYAQRGMHLLYDLSDELKKSGLKGVSYTNLTLFRKFYLTYPQFASLIENSVNKTLYLPNLQTLSEDLVNTMLSPEKLITHLSFSHFIELIKVEEPLKRAFYELETIKGNWSIRQLQRQIGSSLYERIGMSFDKEKLLAEIKGGNFLKPSEIIRDPYIFEFLGLKMKEVFREKDLEEALLNHLREFLLELGTGFCFEARQKSFLIDNRRYSVDLLFYHRVLKCHVLIDLKTDEFTHEDAGQMNFYLNYFREEEMDATDNPPIGIILCALKNEAVVKYSTGGLDNQIFISRYLLQLPSEKELKQFLLDEKRRLGELD